MSALLSMHQASTWFMVGLIWFVQIVHYPLLAQVGPTYLPSYERQHQRLTTYVVLPVMIAEMLLAIYLGVVSPPAGRVGTARVALALLVLIWISTFAVQVPAHERLAAGFEPSVHTWLVHSNWVRTILWTARGGLAVQMLGQSSNL